MVQAGDISSTPADEGATASVVSPDQEIDKPVLMKESLKLGPFQTQIIECKTKPLLGESAHMMVTPLRAYKAQPDGVWPLPPGLHVLHAYTQLKMSSKVSIIVRNMSDSPIFLKKGVRVAHVVSVSPVPPVELSPEMEIALGAEMACEPMTVAMWQKKLLEKLNLDAPVIGPQETWLLQESSSWLSMTSLRWMEMTLVAQVIEPEICINNSEPFKEQFRCIPLPLLDEVHASLRDMLDAGAICPSHFPCCNAVVLVQKKDGTMCFCVDFHRLNMHMKKDSYPLPQIQEALECMVGATHFSTMDFKSRFWQVRMVPESQQYTTFMVGNLGFYEFTHMPFGLYNAPATFQCLMQNTLGELNLTHCIIYLNDVIVFGHTEEHLECLHVMFQWFREFNLKLKLSKCSFFQAEIIYLVHHVSHEGIHPLRTTSPQNLCHWSVISLEWQ